MGKTGFGKTLKRPGQVIIAFYFKMILFTKIF